MTPELLPCPFCGCESVVWSEHYNRVRCNQCFIGTPPNEGHNKNVKAESIAAWNTRTPPPKEPVT